MQVVQAPRIGGALLLAVAEPLRQSLLDRPVRMVESEKHVVALVGPDHAATAQRDALPCDSRRSAPRTGWQDGVVPVLTLMAIHAHPDDESISTGGVLARYSAEGVRTVLVTCTDGALGYMPGRIRPGEEGHDERVLARLRIDELNLACERLGVCHVEMLGYHDSGMAGWQQNQRPTAFCNQSSDAVATRIVELFERYRPQVVVTYFRNTGYNHPDHLHTHDVTVRAVEWSSIPQKLYFTARSRAGQERMREVLAARGIEMPTRRPDQHGARDVSAPPRRVPGIDDELFTTFVDVVPFLSARRAALEAHASQLHESYFLRAPDDIWAEIYGRETFIRARDTTGTPVPESDLFAGLR